MDKKGSVGRGFTEGSGDENPFLVGGLDECF